MAAIFDLPKRFKGTDADADKAEQWIEYFQTKLRCIYNASQVLLYELLMSDGGRCC